MLTARGDEADKVAGLDAGADDYITKPFSHAGAAGAHPGACCAGARRRRSTQAVELGELTLDPATHRVTGDGRDAQARARPSSSCCTS